MKFSPFLNKKYNFFPILETLQTTKGRIVLWNNQLYTPIQCTCHLLQLEPAVVAAAVVVIVDDVVVVAVHAVVDESVAGEVDVVSAAEHVVLVDTVEPLHASQHPDNNLVAIKDEI